MPEDNQSISEQIGEQLTASSLTGRMKDEQLASQKLGIADLISDDAVENALLTALRSLRANKPTERSEKARRYAVTIAEMEKVYSYFKVYVVDVVERMEGI